MQKEYNLYSKERLIELLQNRDRELELEIEKNHSLQRSEAIHRTILTASPDGINYTSLDGRIIMVSPSILRMFGYDVEEEMKGRMISEFLTEQSNEEAKVNIADIMAGTRIGSGVYTGIRKDGTHFVFEANGSVVRDQAGNPMNLLFMIRDITNRLENEKLTRMWADAFENCTHGIAIGDPVTGNIVTCNQAFATLQGRKPEEITGFPILNQYLVEDQEFIRKNIIRSDQTGSASYETRMIRKDGTVYPVQMDVVTVKDDTGKPLYRVATQQDITSRKNAENEIIELNASLEDKIRERTRQLADTNQDLLNEIEERKRIESELMQRTEELENFFNLSLDLLCIGDPEGNLVKVSQSWENMLGYPLEEIQNSKLIKYIHPEDIEKTIAKIKEINHNTDSPNFLLNRLVTQDGKSLYIEWKAFSVGNHNYVTGRDATERIRTSQFEQELLNLTPKLTGIPFNEINDAIHLSLQRFGSFMGADRSYIFEPNPVNNKWNNTFEWCAEGIEPQMDYLQDFDFEITPMWIEKLRNHEDIVIDSVKDLPGSWINEREVLEAQGIQSLLCIPLVRENNLIGFIGLDSVVKQRNFNESEINTLRVLGNMLASLINHRKQEEIIEQTRSNFEIFFNTVDDFLFVLNEEGEIIYTNETVRSRLGYSREELIGSSVLMMHPPDKQDEASNILREILNGNSDSCPVPLMTKDGRYIPVETRAKKGFWNGKAALFGVTKDLSALKLSEEKFSGAFHHNAAIMAIISLHEGKIIDVNSSFLKTLQFTRDEVRDKTMFDLNLWQDPTIRQQIVESVQKNNPVRDLELELPTRSGKKITGLFSADLITLGHEKCLLTTLIDITERKEIERLQRENEERYKVTVNAVDDIIHVVDSHLNILLYNDSFSGELANLGITTNITGSNLFELLPFLPENTREQYFSVFESGEPLFTEECTEFGSIQRWTDTRKIPIKDDQGKTYRVLTLIHDITGRKQAEIEIARQARLIESLLDSIPDVIFFKDVNGVYLACNPTLARLLGRTKQEIIGKTDFDLFDREVAEVFRMHDNLMFEQGKPRHNEEWLTYPDGRKILLDTLKTTLLDANGQIIGLLGISRDITERKKAEEEIIRAKNEAEKANLAKSEFLSRMSHELRTPMNSILGFAQLLNMDELSPKQKRGVNHIIKSGKHLLNLINEVLDISRIEAGRMSLLIDPVQLNRVIRDVIDLIKPMANERQLSVKFEQQSDDLCYVKADAQRLKQVLLNLMNNAVKYNRPAGSILITVNPSANEYDTTYLYRISVSDTGVGIRETDLDMIFRPFERVGHEKSNIEGTGLGLAVAKKLLEAMNGRMGVESKPDVGSTFWIELPHADNLSGDVVPEMNKVVKDHVAGKKGVVLLIEDNQSNIELVDQILSLQRPEIQLITSQFGLKTVKLAVEYQPDLILLDLNLPDIHGIEALEQIIQDERVQSIPVVVVSADALPNQINRLLQAGAVDYITKPIEVQGFLHIVDKYISGIGV